ncbi:MAG: hypothetical protein ACRDX9_08420 [Acidimicrobiia bacterium]
MRRLVATVAAVLIVSVGTPAAATGGYGVVDTETGEWSLADPLGGETTTFLFGNPGDLPFVGDWDCDGDETPGLYRQADGFVYLRNGNTQGIADIRFFFGNPGDIPLAGDFNNDGCDSVGIYRPAEGSVHIINRLGANEGGLGPADQSFFFGNPGDKPFIADFNGDGIDTIGLHRESTGLVYYRNANTAGVAESQFIFGDPGDKIIAGDWTEKGYESVGLFRPPTGDMFLRDTNSQGNADFTDLFFTFAGLPVAGEFGQLPGGPNPATDFSPFTVSGTGSDVIPLSVPGDGPAIIDLNHNGASNFIVSSLDRNLASIELLVNEIGQYSGRRGLNVGFFSFSPPDIVRHLEIDADGPWSATVRPVSQARSVGSALEGSRDDLVRLVGPTPTTLTSTHDGASNFAIIAFEPSGAYGDLLVNEIGAYSGTDPVPRGTKFLDILADGNWTLSVP